MIGQKPLQNNGNFTTVTIGKVNNRKSDQLTEKNFIVLTLSYEGNYAKQLWYRMMNILLTNHDIYTWKDIFQIFIVMSFNNKILQLIALIQLPYVIKVIKHLVFVEIVKKCELL